MQWKFAFVSLGRAEYLQDNDVVANRFQVREPSRKVFLFLSLLGEQMRQSFVLLLAGRPIFMTPLLENLALNRKETPTVPGSIIWDWSTQTVLQKDHINRIRSVLFIPRPL